MTQPDRPDFEHYPDGVLVMPGADPAKLIRLLAGFDESVAEDAARACTDKQAWSQLQAMVDAGFPIAECTTEGEGDGRVKETLLHRCLRIYLHNDLPGRLERLLAMGADPQLQNGQGITALGLLAHQARDLPNKVVKQAFQVLEAYGVRMSDPCHTGQAMASYLLDSPDAAVILDGSCPELAGWARAIVQQDKLASSTAQAIDTTGGVARVGPRRI